MSYYYMMYVLQLLFIYHYIIMIEIEPAVMRTVILKQFNNAAQRYKLRLIVFFLSP